MASAPGSGAGHGSRYHESFFPLQAFPLRLARARRACPRIMREGEIKIKSSAEDVNHVHPRRQTGEN